MVEILFEEILEFESEIKVFVWIDSGIFVFVDVKNDLSLVGEDL